MSGKVSPNSHSTGISTRQVTVSSITPDGTTAVCVDKTGVEVRVPMWWQRAKGVLPAAGETWVLSQDLGQWSFAMIVATSATPFATGPVSGTTGAFSASEASSPVLSVTNTHASPSAPAGQIISQAAADQALGIQVTGDTSQRFAVDSNGQHAWGPGSAAADLFFNRLSAGVARLSGDLKLTGNLYLDANWQTSASFANGWTGTFAYRRIALNLMVIAYTLVPGTVVDGTQVTTVPSAYYPMTNRHIPATVDALKTNGSSFEAARIRLDTAGIITCWGVATSATFLDGCMMVPLDV